MFTNALHLFIEFPVYHDISPLLERTMNPAKTAPEFERNVSSHPCCLKSLLNLNQGEGTCEDSMEFNADKDLQISENLVNGIAVLFHKIEVSDLEECTM